MKLFEDEGVVMAPSKSIGYFLPFQVALKYGGIFFKGIKKMPLKDGQHSGLHNLIPYGIFVFPALFEIKHLARKLYFNMV